MTSMPVPDAIKSLLRYRSTYMTLYHQALAADYTTKDAREFATLEVQRMVATGNLLPDSQLALKGPDRAEVPFTLGDRVKTVAAALTQYPLKLDRRPKKIAELIPDPVILPQPGAATAEPTPPTQAPAAEVTEYVAPPRKLPDIPFVKGKGEVSYYGGHGQFWDGYD